jgi:DNA-binding HxlR family transcriptional regulator
MKEFTHDTPECKKAILAVHDAMDVLSGKWKIYIIAALCFNKKRYSDLLRDIRGISGKMLSRELKELETHRLVKRTVMDTQPITVSYELTEYGLKLKEVINQLAVWGMEHRKMIIEEMRNN